MFQFLKEDAVFRALPAHAEMVINVLRANLEPSTDSGYATMWNSVLRTRDKLLAAGSCWDPRVDPNREEAWLIWAADLAMKGVTAGAIAKYRWGIQDTLRGLGISVDFKQFHLVEKFIKSWRRIRNLSTTLDRMRGKAAMTPEVAMECHPFMDEVTWAIVAVSVLNLGRYSPLVPITREAPRVSNLQKVKFPGEEVYSISVWTKEDREKVGTLFYIFESPKGLCAGKAMRRMAAQRIKEGTWMTDRPLFSYDGVNPVPRNTFRKKLNHAIRKSGRNPADFVGNMFRRGGAQALNFLGLGDEEIKRIGRWKSDVFKKYFGMDGPSYLKKMRALSRATDAPVMRR
jgi:hypothetical protein